MFPVCTQGSNPYFSAQQRSHSRVSPEAISVFPLGFPAPRSREIVSSGPAAQNAAPKLRAGPVGVQGAGVQGLPAAAAPLGRAAGGPRGARRPGGGIRAESGRRASASQWTCKPKSKP